MSAVDTQYSICDGSDEDAPEQCYTKVKKKRQGMLTSAQERTLVIFHVCICAAHFALGLWALIDASDWKIPVTTSVVKWKRVNDSLGCDIKNTTTGKGNCYVAQESVRFDKLRDISLAELVVTFHFLSFTWQALVLASLWTEHATLAMFYFTEVAQGRNTMRWVEYSISAPIMVIVIAVLLGQMDIIALFLLAICTSVLMLFGFLHERIYLQANSPQDLESLIPHIAGWILFTLTWTALGVPFFLSLALSEAKPPPAILVVVYAVFFVMLSFFASFGVAQTAHTFAATRRPMSVRKLVKVHFVAEISYNVLSLASKTTLGVLLYLGVRARDRALNLDIQ